MGTRKETRKGTGGDRELELHRRKARRNRLLIIAAVVIVVITGVSIQCAVAHRAEQNGMNDVPIKATWIEPQVADNLVFIPVSEIENNRNIHFRVETQTGAIAFMAYKLDGEIYVRSNVCPPCWSIGFSLQRDILVCDACQTTFEAKTGKGISGACVDYPKAAGPYEIKDGNLEMQDADLIAAYQDTLEPGWP